MSPVSSYQDLISVIGLMSGGEMVADLEESSYDLIRYPMYLIPLHGLQAAGALSYNKGKWADHISSLGLGKSGVQGSVVIYPDILMPSLEIPLLP